MWHQKPKYSHQMKIQIKSITWRCVTVLHIATSAPRHSWHLWSENKSFNNKPLYNDIAFIHLKQYVINSLQLVSDIRMAVGFHELRGRTGTPTVTCVVCKEKLSLFHLYKAIRRLQPFTRLTLHINMMLWQFEARVSLQKVVKPSFV